ncbi:MAG: hypothetical protein HQK96_10965, partial [Nitrospirae bacterium]|nr:hypothetical protein [Nitrospirota bacterium]
MYKSRNLLKLFMSIAAASIVFSAGIASADEKPLQGEDILLDTYHKNIANLETTTFSV